MYKFCLLGFLCVCMCFDFVVVVVVFVFETGYHFEHLTWPRATIPFLSSVLPPEYTNYKCTLLHLAYEVLRIEPRTLCTLPTEIHFQLLHFLIISCLGTQRDLPASTSKYLRVKVCATMPSQSSKVLVSRSLHPFG